MSCPYTSPQNGKAKCIIRSINNVVHSLLFQAAMPPHYWVEAFSTATSLLNILLTKTLDFSTPHLALLCKPAAYDHLRVFGCKCYLNLSATAVHKLAPRSMSSLATPLTTKVTAALISPQIESSCLGMSSLMKLPSLLLSVMALARVRTLVFECY